jgi:glucans biosynthesis protein
MKKAALNAMRLAPRCGARTRAGHPCEGPAMRGKKRCRMHGSGGAPLGNRNGEKHGLRGRAMRDVRELARLLRAQAALL